MRSAITRNELLSIAERNSFIIYNLYIYLDAYLLAVCH